MSKRILVVDDEQNIRDIISEFLQTMGYTVVVAVDGQDALDKLQVELFDLYIVDVLMPRMNGLELMEHIKEIQPLAVIIIATGFSNIDVAVKAIRSGAFHYLTKPINADDLANVVLSGLKHSNELGEVNGISPASLEISRDLIDLLLLKNFTPDQQNEFHQIGNLVPYKAEQIIPLNDQIGTMIWVESGRVSVRLSGTHVETLQPGDIWGEETFISANSVFTELIVQTDSLIRHFNRKKMLEFFRYQDEILSKQFLINLTQSIYVKWRKSVYKIGLYAGYKA
jgi:CheY-like chemotaxis protein